jgi:hypothetical protein
LRPAGHIRRSCPDRDAAGGTRQGSGGWAVRGGVPGAAQARLRGVRPGANTGRGLGGGAVPRIFLSHSSRDTAQAIALKRWLGEQEPGLAEEVFLDLDRDTGIAPGERWKEALRRANERCEAVICLLSARWEASPECLAEYRTAETLGKRILCAGLEPLAGKGITGEWQRCDLFGDGRRWATSCRCRHQSPRSGCRAPHRRFERHALASGVGRRGVVGSDEAGAVCHDDGAGSVVQLHLHQ